MSAFDDGKIDEYYRKKLIGRIQYSRLTAIYRIDKIISFVLFSLWRNDSNPLLGTISSWFDIFGIQGGLIFRDGEDLGYIGAPDLL